MSDPTSRQAVVLVVEDRKEVQSALVRLLRTNGFTVHAAADGDTALRMAMDMSPDLLLLDVGLPRRDGVQVARLLRERGFAAPILMLTARDTTADKVIGLEAGADDYLVKPFEYDELLARVRALLRRAAVREDHQLLRVGDLTLNPLTRDVRRGRRQVPLTQREYELLLYFMRNVERTISREMLAQQVWKQEFEPATNVVDVYVNYLRRKLEVGSETPLILTVRGQGYVMRAHA